MQMLQEVEDKKKMICLSFSLNSYYFLIEDSDSSPFYFNYFTTRFREMREKFRKPFQIFDGKKYRLIIDFVDELRIAKIGFFMILIWFLKKSIFLYGSRIILCYLIWQAQFKWFLVPSLENLIMLSC